MERLDEEFLQEARSNLRSLTDGLLAVEGRRDAETVDELFRTAHSLKGACQTVGLSGAGQLAHSIEDLLDALRGGDVEPTAELVDDALDAVDDLEATIEAAATGTEPEVDPVASGSALRDALEAHRTGAETEEPVGSAPDGDAADESVPSVDDEGLSEDVLAALDDASEFDDIDALVAEMDDVDDDGLGDWGVLDEDGPVDATVDTATESDPGGTPEDPTAFFESVKREVDEEATDVDDLQREIDAVEFGEFDEDDDVSIDELLELDPTEEPVTVEDPGEPADTVPQGPTEDAADAGGGPVEGSNGDVPVAGGTDDPESPSTPSDANGVVDEGTASPPREAEATDDGPTDGEPTDAGPADGEPTPGEPVAGVSDAREPAAEDPSFPGEPGDDGSAGDEPTDEPATGRPFESIDRAVAEAEDAGFQFGSTGTTDAADESAANGSTDGASAAGDAANGATGASADADTAPGAGPNDPGATGARTDDVPDPDSMPDVPEPDSMPDVDLDLDLSEGAVDAESEPSAGAGIDVDLDDEMVAFESRFAGALDRSPTGPEPENEAEPERSDVFQAAVTTIGESRLDGDRFGLTDGQESPTTALSGGLPPLTVTVETAERLMTIAEELSLVRHRVEDALGEEVPDLQRLAAEYRRTVTDVRLMPLETAIEDIPRTVRDLVRSQGKEVDLAVEDVDVRLDRSVIERLRDPLVHLARNAVDHGIEPPDERVAAGKPPEGRIELRTEQVGDEVVIELSDDGRGIDPDRVRESAVERGHLTPEAAEELTDEEAYDLLFEAGVSTAEEVTDVSGRGVGMDVVGHRVAALDGRVEVESERGRGTTVRLVVPVSIALTEVVFVEVGEERFGVPMAGVEGVTEAPDDLEHRGFLRLGDVPSAATPGEIDPGDDVPFVHLREALGVNGGRDPGHARVLWVRTGTDLLAVGCDRVVGSREVIIRPYEDLLRDVPGVQGATTRADGRPVNVIDVGSL